MRKRKLGSFLLALAMVVSLLAPSILSVPVRADGATGSGNGMVYNKTAVPNGNGGYTITLEAYATGAKFSSEVTKDVPTDIILVLDQSGSMDQNFVKHEEGSFREYTDKTNANLYDKRHNGGAENLYHKLDDGTYVSVSVDAEFGDATYTPISTRFGVCVEYIQYRDNMYVKINGQYQKVETVVRIGQDPACTYYVGDTVVATGRYLLFSRPDFSNETDGKFYTAEINENNTKYTYYYTDENGIRQEVGTSTGASASFSNPPLYEMIPGGDTTVTKLSALKDAVTLFKNSVETKANSSSPKVKHRIAVVGFACSNTGSDSNYNNYQNTEIFIGADGYRYGREANANVALAFQDMSDTAGVDNVTASIGALDANGATYVNHGMELASTIFANDPLKNDTERKRVVIVFTDGVPGYSGFDSGVANSAISQADAIRSNYGADVYAVGIFDGANAASGGNANGNDTEKANWFMQRLSNNLGSPRSPSYYLSANDSGSLNSIFQQIAENIETGGSTTTLGANTVIKDFVSEYFQLPAGTSPDKITVTTVPCTGITNDVPAWGTAEQFNDATVTVDPETGAVTVTGFDFAANYVGMDTINGVKQLHNPAKKLVISFDVVPKEGFLGGNDVPTNASAGIYDNSAATDPVITFGVPTVNVPIATPKFTVNDKTIYEGKSTAVSGLYTLPDYTGDNAWKAAYVNVTTTGTTAGETVSPTVCTDYTVTVTYAPKTDGIVSQNSGGGTANASTGVSTSKTATVHVLHPVVTADVHDVEKYYGESYTLGNDAGGSITLNWVDGHADHTGIPAVEGTAPYTETAFHLEYAAAQFGGTVPKNDFDVTVTVKKGTDVVTGATITTTCNIGSNCTTPDTDGVYTVHVKTCQLTIEKTGGADGEPYVFDVYKNGTKYSEVSIVGNSTATIVELPVGSYTIVEDQGWSWRYPNPSYTGNGVTLNATTPSGTITCSNSLNKEYWLNGFSGVETNVSGESHSN